MKTLEKQRFYKVIWEELKNFPRGLALGNKNSPNVSGPGAAAFISPGIGAFLMMLIHHLADSYKPLEELLCQLGSWIPGTYNHDLMYGHIGSFSGKQTILLIGWLVSWLFLGLIWRDRYVKISTILFWMFASFMAATIMIWPPLFPYLSLMPKS